MVVKSIETKIKEIIKERGLQQKYVYEKIKLSPEQFSLCMREKRKFKTIEFLALCSFLGLSVQDFEECKVG